MMRVQQSLTQEMKKRNDAFDVCRRECDALMIDAAVDLDAFDQPQLDQIELKVDALSEAY